MRVSTRVVEAVTVVSITGDLDARTAPVAQEQLAGAIPVRAPALLDMTDVQYVSSAGLRTMLMVYRRAQQVGTRIALAGVSPSLRSMLAATGFLRFFQVAASVREGIARLAGGPDAWPAGTTYQQEDEMTFNVSTSTRDSTAVIVIEGDLDARSAPTLQEKLDQVVRPGLRRLVLDLHGMDYLSSAGLRQLIYARQGMTDDLRMVLAGANAQVRQTIELVGFDQSVTFVDELPE